MMAKLMLAVMVSAAVMLGGVGAVAAAGSDASGTCDQTQDQTRLKLKDGSCDQIQNQTQLQLKDGTCDQTQDQIRLQLQDGSCDGSNCQDHLYDWNYNWNYSNAD
jgi:hypothetical protein